MIVKMNNEIPITEQTIFGNTENIKEQETKDIYIQELLSVIKTQEERIENIEKELQTLKKILKFALGKKLMKRKSRYKVNRENTQINE